jgi:hypothetical protein
VRALETVQGWLVIGKINAEKYFLEGRRLDLEGKRE